jgi:hypothetical protein
MAGKCGVSVGSCHTIFTEHLNMYRLAENLFPQVMSHKWKEQYVAIGQEILLWAEGKNNFLKTW